MKVKGPLRGAVVGAALALGGIAAVPSPASAAQSNNLSMYYQNDGTTGQAGDQWENYTRSHTSTGNIDFTWSNRSELTGARMDLRNESNYHVFASKDTGERYGKVRLASNWGPTKFNVGLFAGLSPLVQGWYRGTLYY